MMSRFFGYLVTACVALVVMPAGAEEGAGCELRVGAIIASNSGKSDVELRDFGDKWREVFPYESYKMLKDERKSVKWRTRAGFDIPGGRYLVISPRKVKDGRIFLKIVLLEGSRPLVDTVLAIKDEGSVLFGGQKHESGVLLLEVSAKSHL